MTSSNARTLKLVPRIVASYVANKWAEHERNATEPTQAARAAIGQRLPYCQDIGEHLDWANYFKSSKVSWKSGGQRNKEQLARNDLEGRGGKSSQVVIMAIRIQNFYDEIGASASKQSSDEAA